MKEKNISNKTRLMMFVVVLFSFFIITGSIIGIMIASLGVNNFLELINSSYKEIPTNGSPIHIIFLVITAILITISLIFIKKLNDKRYRIIILIGWLILMFIWVFREIYNTIYYPVGGPATVKYLYENFPFQLCSFPSYLLPIIVFMEDNKFKNTIESLCAPFMLLGGASVLAMPSTVFSDSILISIQSPTHHMIMLVLSIIIIAYKKSEVLNLKSFLMSLIGLAVILLIALIINVLVYQFVPYVHSGEVVCNMCYISPYFAPVVPLFKDLHGSVPFIVYLLIYVLTLVVIAYILSIITSLIFTHKIKPLISLKESEKILASKSIN